MLSQMSEVSRLSMAPRNASTSADLIMPGSACSPKVGSCGSGKPVGMLPMIGAALKYQAASRLPTPSATSGDGANLRRRSGRKAAMTSETSPTATAPGTGAAKACGSAVSTCSGPPAGLTRPTKGASCRMMMMQPMPLMNPEITG